MGYAARSLILTRLFGIAGGSSAMQYERTPSSGGKFGGSAACRGFARWPGVCVRSPSLNMRKVLGRELLGSAIKIGSYRLVLYIDR